MKTIPTPTKRNRFNKLLAILLALALWFYVAGHGEMTARNAAEVELKYIDLGENLVVSGPEKVTVRMWGTVRDGGQIQEAYVDLSDLGPGTYTLPVSLLQNDRALLAKVEPDRVEVVITEMQQKLAAIKPRSQSQLPDGLELTDIFAQPGQCSVQGEQSEVNRVETIIAPVTLAAESGMQTIPVTLQAVDKAGQILENVRLIPARATIYAVVSEKMASKKVSVKAVWTGNVAEGAELGKITAVPAEVLVAGNPAALEKLTLINTKGIEVSGKSASFTQEAELVVPEGVKVYPDRVMVNIEIRAATPAEKPEEEETPQP